jgi:hypothetical protein
MLKCFQAEEEASYINKNRSVAGSTLAPNRARDEDEVLRALILSERPDRNSREL